jgi:hypothetical protein
MKDSRRQTLRVVLRRTEVGATQLGLPGSENHEIVKEVDGRGRAKPDSSCFDTLSGGDQPLAKQGQAHQRQHQAQDCQQGGGWALPTRPRAYVKRHGEQQPQG